jgi:PST family polysaccharide transporter
MAVLGYSIALPMMFLGKYIIVMIFGQTYESGSGVLMIQIWTGLFCFFGYVKSLWIINEGRTKYDLVEKSSGAIINILLNLFLIPLYRETGAAIATLISYGFADYFMCLLYPPARRLGWVMTKALALNFFTQKNTARS